jgi:hypothetical protein
MHSKLTAARWRKVQTDLPHIGNLPVLQGAAKIASQIVSGINEFITWRAEEDSWYNHDKLEKVGLPHKKWEHCLRELLHLTGCPAPKELPEVGPKSGKTNNQNIWVLHLILPSILILLLFATTLARVVTWPVMSMTLMSFRTCCYSI